MSRYLYNVSGVIFSSDTAAECELIRNASIEAGAVDAVICKHWAEGGRGALALANAVVTACEKSSSFRYVFIIFFFII